MLIQHWQWIMAALGGSLIITAFVLHRRGQKSLPPSQELSPDLNLDLSPTKQLNLKLPEEALRQMALVAKDEFAEHYHPLIEKVREYSQLTEQNALDHSYFDTLYKALRKRRSAIFEFGTSEKDQHKRALWTYALFASLSIRYVIRQCSHIRFIDKSGEPIVIALAPQSRLKAANKQPLKPTTAYPSSLLNLHLIDKLMPASMIEVLANECVYPYIVNAVTGFHQQASNPFYEIIHQVESFIDTPNTASKSDTFQQTMQQVLRLIERNTISKNTATSLIFEGTSHLLIERCLLWELFTAYSVTEQTPLTKGEFETSLSTAFKLGTQLDQTISYSVTIEDMGELHLTNMVSLAYRTVPSYVSSQRKRIGKKLIARDLIPQSEDQCLSEQTPINKSVQAGFTDEPPTSKTTPKTKRASSERKAALNDLFSN